MIEYSQKIIIRFITFIQRCDRCVLIFINFFKSNLIFRKKQIWIVKSSTLQNYLKPEQMQPNKLNKKFTIHSDVRKAIIDILAKSPQMDQDKVLSTITEQKSSLSLTTVKNEAIKKGVEEFFKQRNQNEANKVQNLEKIKSITQAIEIDPKPTKKTKKNEFIIQFQDNQNYQFKNLGGISQAYQRLQSELFSLILKDSYYKSISRAPPNRGFLLCGSPGCGKTILANCILSYLTKLQDKKITAFSVNSLQFLSGDADDKMRRVFEAAEQKMPSIIFFDNLEQLCNKDNNKRMQSLPSLTLYNYMNQIKDKEIYLIGATSAAEKLDVLTKPGMFYKQIKINNPDQIQRKEIIQKVLNFYNHSVGQNLKQLSLLTAGYVAIDIISLFKEAAVRCVERITANKQEITVEEKPQNLISLYDIREAFKEIQPILKKDGFAKIPNVKLEDVGALEDIKYELTQEIIMPLRQQEKFRSMNFEVSGGGILLYGPPGCGKTMIAKAIANEANANFITVKGPELLTKYVGQSEQAVRKVFQRARLSSPCIIFFDQFDALAPKRQDQGNQVTERVVNTLLNELNGVDDRKMVFVIAATNRPDIIDEAVLRSGRIEKHLYVPLPNSRQRYQILAKITRKVNHEENLELEEIAAKAQNFSGADLYFLVKKSIISAVSNNRPKIDANDLKSAFETYKKDKYNKNNRLKLSQFAEEDENDATNLINLDNQDNANPSEIKKSKSIMEVESNETNKEVKKNGKSKVKQNLLNSFIEHLLNLSKNQKDKQEK